MLTTTYSFVVFASEQQNARRLLRKLEHRLRKGAIHEHAEPVVVDAAWLDTTFNDIMQIDRCCHERKIALYVIPLLRRLPAEARNILVKLDAIGADTVRLLRSACEQAQRVFDGIQIDAAALISTITMYCTQMQERLALEETELLPAARVLLAPEEWFRIAAQLLADGKRGYAPASSSAFSSFPCGQRQLMRYA